MEDTQAAEPRKFKTAREILFEQYETTPGPYYAHSKPYESTIVFLADIESTDPGTADTPATAVAVFKTGQRREAFGYGLKDRIPGTNWPATTAETNLKNANKTNASEEFAIDSFSALCQDVHAFYNSEIPGGVTPGTEQIGPAKKGEAAFGALVGDGPATVYDPGAILTPPQVRSPINLQDTFYEALAKKLVGTVKFDESGDVPLGALAGWPSGPSSYLHAHGHPSYGDRAWYKEGFIWRREGSSDSQFSLFVELARPVCVPIFGVKLPGKEGWALPKQIRVDIKIRAHGVGYRLLSVNA